MNKDIIEIIKTTQEIYAKKQENATVALQNLCDNDKDFYELFKAYRKSLLNYNKLNLKIKEKIDKYLISKKLFNIINPSPNCKLCNDTGLINTKPCKCVLLKYYNEFTKNCKIPLHSFSDINYNFYQNNKQHYKKLVEKLQNYCKNFPNNTLRNIAFIGNSGNGKTYLLSCIANEIKNKFNTVTFLSAMDLNNKLLEYHTTFNDQKTLDPFLKCDLLIVDDLGQEPIFKNVTIQYIQYIFNYRLQNHLHFAFSSNLNVQEINDRYGDTITSRLFDRNNIFIYEFIFENLRKIIRIK